MPTPDKPAESLEPVVIMVDGWYKFHCPVCDYSFDLPKMDRGLPMWAFIGLIEAFQKDHRVCTDPDAEETDDV